MKPERWARIKPIFYEAAEQPVSERPAFIRSRCDGDESLAMEIESLLGANDRAGSFIEALPNEEATVDLEDLAIEPMIGQKIGPYKVISLIGRGGMGEVYLAQDSRLARKVALKLLPPHIAQDRQRLERFKREARAASALNHPNILTIHEIGDAEGCPFIATEFIEGLTLRQRMADPQMKLGEALDVATQVASALSAAHQAGIVHRDIKPENIMIRRDGYVKTLDFGLAKLIQPHAAGPEVSTLVKTEEGVIMGTARYMSPEQARGQAVDARTDIWSLGVVLYEMLSGRTPFEGETHGDVIVSVLEREPPALARYTEDIPPELDWIVKKALRKEREERYQTAKELLSDLKGIKQRLEFEAELERSAQSDVRGQSSIRTAKQVAARTGDVEAHSTSSARYVMAAIKRHKRAAAPIALLMLIAAVALFFFINRAPALTEKDAILLADFDNRTGDDVFDGALKQALAIQLEQSPFLNVYPEERVREALRYMGRSADERVTKDVAREICQRQVIKAMLTGSISSLGSHYVIGMECVNAQTGDVIAREQAEAESKEQVLKTLGGAATKLREKLGESLASMQKFNAPIEQATTSSLEALRAFTLGNEMLSAGKYFEAIPFFKRAVELDPDFALAYLKLGGAHSATWKDQLAAEYVERAFELRGRTSEREKFYISNYYYALTTGEIDKSIEVLELWKQTYPRDITPRSDLSGQYIYTGQYHKAVEEAGEALRLDPNVAGLYDILGISFLCLNRFDEARAIFEQAVEKGPDSVDLHYNFHNLAFVQGDEATMQRQVDWANGKPHAEGALHYAQAHAAAFSGQRRKSQELFRRSAEANDRYGLKEGAAWGQADYALLNAAFGDCRQTKESAVNALNIARSKQALVRSALALALCGETSQAQSLTGELVKRYPKDTLVNTIWLPTIQAALEINRGNTEQAIQLLQVAHRFEMGFEVQGAWPAYVRGLAYLRGRAGAEAMAEFQKIIAHRGVVAVYASYPLAHLGVARAAALTGDTAKSRKAYEDFFALWKDADADIPIFQQAKQEYEKLR